MESGFRNLRGLFSEIIQCFSICESSIFGRIYIKHFNNFNIAELDYHYKFYLNLALEKGVPSNEQKTKFLVENGFWDIKKEDKLDELNKTRGTLELNKKNEFLRSKRKKWQDEIDKINKEINTIENEKTFLLGTTSEIFANKKCDELYIKLSFFKDKELKTSLFDDNKQDFEELDNTQTAELFKILGTHLQNFDQDNLKKISLSPFFLNLFTIASENIYDLFGKPAIELTLYQVDIFQYGKFFRNAIMEMGSDKLPSDITNDPDKFVEFIECNRTFDKVSKLKENEGSSVGLMGAKKEDLELLNIQPNQQFSLDEELKKKKGKSLNMAELMKLHRE